MSKNRGVINISIINPVLELKGLTFKSDMSKNGLHHCFIESQQCLCNTTCIVVCVHRAQNDIAMYVVILCHGWHMQLSVFLECSFQYVLWLESYSLSLHIRGPDLHTGKEMTAREGGVGWGEGGGEGGKEN